MQLSQEQCYRAVQSRDARFDGQFFTAVITTGVYCRPICPARTPRRKNVRFYPCAAAAEQDGFRPCRRCRPESAPGTPAWTGTSAVVARAMRLIEQGALDDGPVEDLAERIGVGPRHLRRLFVDHLGAPPAVIARVQRAHLARRLIEQTDWTMTRIAEAARFPSVRRFNAAMRRTFGCPPSGLRGRRHAPAAGLTLRLAYRPPYAWEPLIAFLAARAIPHVECVRDGTYHRTASHGASATILSIRPDRDRGALEMHIADPPAHVAELVARARHMFDLAAEPSRIAAHLGADPALGPAVAAHPGLRVPRAWDGFEVAVRAILGQQVTVRGATTLAGRLVEAFGQRIGDGDLSHVFPTPDALATARVADIAAIGLPPARARAIQELARATRRGTVAFCGALDSAGLIAALIEIPGVGPWTAQYVAMRALGDPDAFPASDLGLRRALGKDAPLTARQVADRAEAWRPWRSYAALHLWTFFQP